jgi:poly-gamma-glutamate capsule biosynthesis protein CapA/YwtB (metallophosphatase superfamily)
MPGNNKPLQRDVTRIFLCGDVMTGRGVDQVLPHPCDPHLHEDYVQSASDYVRLAEQVNGPIAAPVGFSYIWGAALEELDRARPDARIINLETSITHNNTYVTKGINYRMSPQNAACLSAAGINCCVLANNHVLDWERAGLLETLKTLEHLRIKFCGAGRNLAEARTPAFLDIADKGRIIVFSFAMPTSGTPGTWSATAGMPGVNFLTHISPLATASIVEQIARVKQPRDVIIVSIHWGPNWGYDIMEEQRRFAHDLVDRADVSIVHGHSSHHWKGIEVYRNRLILYGCGDFLNDYEGIKGYEEFRPDLVLMYFPALDVGTADLIEVEMVPLQIQRFQLVRPSPSDFEWLHQTLDEQSRILGTRVQLKSDGKLSVTWRR